jgi:flagellar basal-body rod protein FlgB
MKPLFDTVDRLGGALEFHRERHSILASNVANVDTPGFKPFDLAPALPPDDPSALATTDARHIGAGGGGQSEARVFSDPGEAGPDGNAVELERELAKIDANRVRYGACAELVTRKFALLKYASGDGG